MPSKKRGKDSFSLLIKPSGPDCNLRCSYCFYLGKRSLYPERTEHRMTDAILERIIYSYFKTRQDVYSFGWQGGEPLLLGADFFRKAVEFQERHGRPGMRVSNTVQTNGTLLNDEMARLFSEYRFLLGISIDGPEDLHDIYRRNVGGRGSYKDVVQGIEVLRRNGVEFNALVLVSGGNVHSPERVYSHLKDLGIRFQQYIPCVEFDSEGDPLPWTVSGEDWGAFLERIYRMWVDGDTEYISIRNFDAVLHRLLNGASPICSMGRNCSDYFLVEHNGDIYPCDFFVESKNFLGNIGDTELRDLRSSKSYRVFGRRKNEWAGECARCKFLFLCAGDCLKHRFFQSENPRQKSWLCAGWKLFFESTLPGFERIVDRIRTGR